MGVTRESLTGVEAACKEFPAVTQPGLNRACLSCLPAADGALLKQTSVFPLRFVISWVLAPTSWQGLSSVFMSLASV